MKRGTKITVFIASMALTVGSMLAIIGPRHHRYCGMNRNDDCSTGNYYHGGCGNWNNMQNDSIAK